MNLRGKRVGLVSPGGEIRAYFNAGVLGELMRRGLNITRISGTSGGIMCLLPFFKSRNFTEYDKYMKDAIQRELISTDWFREIKEFFKKRIFHYTLHPDLEIEINIDPEFIRDEYLSPTDISLKRMKETDVIVSVTAVREGRPLESMRFNVSELCLNEGHEGLLKAAKIIQAAATIFSKSEPVLWNESKEEMYLLDGFYTDNIPMSDMFNDHLYSKANEVDVIFLINNSNLKNYKLLIQKMLQMKNDYLGLYRYSYPYKSLLNYTEMSLSISGNDKEQVDLSVMMNRMLREKLLRQGKNPEDEYGRRIEMTEFDGRNYTLKPFYVIEPENNARDIRLLSSNKDKESVAEKNYQLGREETARILDLIESGKIKPY